MPSKSLLHEVIISEFINQICNFVQMYLIQFASDVDFCVPGVTPGVLFGFSAKQVSYKKQQKHQGTMQSWKAFSSCQLEIHHGLTVAGLGRSHIHSTAVPALLLLTGISHR